MFGQELDRLHRYKRLDARLHGQSIAIRPFPNVVPLPVSPTRSQPHWDARHTIAGLNISTGPTDFAFMLIPLHDAITNSGG